MNIPAIGGTKGIFEIFIPGVFLLLNLGITVYLFPLLDPETRKLLEAGVSNSALIIVVLICFGYLIGVTLRLFQTDALDKLSSLWIGLFIPGPDQDNKSYKKHNKDKFPYIEWIGVMTEQYLPEEVQAFYKETWGKRTHPGFNKQYFNFCKTLVASKDANGAAEIYTAESLTRYITGMFYALTSSFVLITAIVITRYRMLGEINAGLLILLGAYLLAILAIVSRFRFVRIKEVETVYATCFKNKDLFVEARPQPAAPANGKDQQPVHPPVQAGEVIS